MYINRSVYVNKAIRVNGGTTIRMNGGGTTVRMNTERCMRQRLVSYGCTPSSSSALKVQSIPCQRWRGEHKKGSRQNRSVTSGKGLALKVGSVGSRFVRWASPGGNWFAAGWPISFIAKGWLTASRSSELGCMGLGQVLNTGRGGQLSFLVPVLLAPDNEQPI